VAHLALAADLHQVLSELETQLSAKPGSPR
jgi:hypothetical protein